MTIPNELSGGRLVEFDPTAPKVGPNAEAANMKIFSSSGLGLSMLCVDQVGRVSTEAGGSALPTHVEVFVRKTDTATYVCVMPSDPQRPQARELRPNGAVLDLRGFFATAGLQLQDGMIYVMRTQITRDAERGRCVAANWSTAEVRPKTRADEVETGPGQPAGQPASA